MIHCSLGLRSTGWKFTRGLTNLELRVRNPPKVGRSYLPPPTGATAGGRSPVNSDPPRGKEGGERERVREELTIYTEFFKQTYPATC